MVPLLRLRPGKVVCSTAATHPRATEAWADTDHRIKAIDHDARLGVDAEVVQRDRGIKGFKLIPRRRVVERTLGRLMHHRHLARDHQTHPTAPKP